MQPGKAESFVPPLLIVYQNTANLKKNPHNSRTHSKRQIRHIADSIAQFGFTNPIIVDQENTVIAGHGRVDAAKLRGIEQVPTVKLEHLSSDQIRAYIIADNRLAELAGWDRETLATELQYLTVIDGLEITVTGFEVAEIDEIIEDVRHHPSRTKISPTTSSKWP